VRHLQGQGRWDIFALAESLQGPQLFHGLKELAIDPWGAVFVSPLSVTCLGAAAALGFRRIGTRPSLRTRF
jgi:hypothetical protein